ncbi:MAG: glycosyltransferase family 4 protein [Anaerolineales bacterium]|nr:glycosyltransferase family 4 protein [Anaerolineales bacterium]
MKSFTKNIMRSALQLASMNWKAYSHLILYADNAGWVLDWERQEMLKLCNGLNIPVVKPIWKYAATPQSVFFFDQFFLQNDDWLELLPNRIGFAYFHGIPHTGFEMFDHIYQQLEKYHTDISRIQVTHSEMRNLILSTGIDPQKVFQIPIGINLGFFPFRAQEMKQKARQEFGIPQSAFVIGSIQKDGIGWGDGMEPKLEKGPDILVATASKLKKDIPELLVLLVGPARGYVKAGLEQAGVRYIHIPQQPYPQIGKIFSALDMYLISSRQEGGPKAVLESMASGIPLVTTRVGHAMDIVINGQNGWITDVGDVEALTAHSLEIYNASSSDIQPILENARKVAEENSYEKQTSLWADFMKGFVDTD